MRFGSSLGQVDALFRVKLRLLLREEIPNNVMIFVSGHPTAAGQVSKYDEGNGWVFLDEKGD